MSNLIRFEFYNNFDIWYDLYQESGGDPNHIINMMMFIDKSVYEYECEDKFGYGYRNGNGYGYVDGNGYGYRNGNGFGYGYRNGNGDGYGRQYSSYFIDGNGTA